MVVGSDHDPVRQIAVYAAKLRAYPAAAVEIAVDEWVDTGHRFWPSMAEFLTLVRGSTREARLLLEALR